MRKLQAWRISLANILVVGQKPGLVHKSKSTTWNRVSGWIKEDYDWTDIYNLDDEVIFTVEQTYKYSHIVALGNVASDYLNKLGVRHCKIPHPSRLNRMWNDPQTEIDTVNKLNKYLHFHRNVL